MRFQASKTGRLLYTKDCFLRSAWPFVLLQNLSENWGLLAGATAGLSSSACPTRTLLGKPAVAPHC